MIALPADELFGNRYFRLLRHKKQRFDIFLMQQHFHITIGRYTLEIDW